MRITVVGAGYVGLSLAVLLAQKHSVTAVDIDATKVEKIQQRKSPIVDSLLEEYLSTKQLDLTATTESGPALESADVVIIATPTDYDPEKNYFDTSSVDKMIEQALHLSPDSLIVIKSTVPVGFTARVSQHHRTDRIVFSPEFLREGNALYDNLHPSRVIVGVDAESSLQKRRRRLPHCCGSWRSPLMFPL